MNCPGDEVNACGDPYRMRVYGFGGILGQYNLDGITLTSSVGTSSVAGNTITPRSEALTSSSVTAGSDSTTLPAKQAIAHHMVGNTFPYTPDTWSTDISLALSAGIDGFALNVGSGGVGNWQREQVKNAYSAGAALSASGNTFGLFLSLDMT
jgi:glucan endo-1,3-alpha-glucosidase